MIQLYTGTPGSGKSLHMAKDIYYFCNCKKERLVIANFKVKEEKLKFPNRFCYIPNVMLDTPNEVIDKAYKYFEENNKPISEASIILFIDECQLLFNSRDWNIKGRSDWLSFFTQHRKLGFNVILTAQFDMMIDKQIRSLIEYETIHRKCTNYGVIGGIFQLLAFGQPLFVSVEKWYSINERTGYSFFFAKKKYYELYDTFNTFKNIGEIGSRKNLLTTR